MAIKLLESEHDLEMAYPVLKELRTDLTYTEYKERLEAAKKSDGFHLAGMIAEGRCVAVMGFRVLTDFVHGRHLYVDDLVTISSERSKGHGAALLQYAEEQARRLSCKNLRLCTGVTNKSGQRFYEREGWAARSIAYKKILGR